MKKTSVLSIVLIATLVIAALAGCGPKANSSSTTPPAGTTFAPSTTVPEESAGANTTTVPNETTAPIETTVPEETTATPTTEPEANDSTLIHVYTPSDWATPRLWAWENATQQNLYSAWPGQALNATGDHYTVEIPLWVDSVLVNGNDGSVQTVDLSIEPGSEIWIVVFSNSAKVYYHQPTEDELTPPAEKTITVYASVPSDWSSPCCWAWLNSPLENAFNSWPGEAMTKKDGYYAVTVPGWIDYVIINGNGGSVQTADLPVASGWDLWVIVTADGAQVVYSRSEADALIGK